MVTTVVTTLAAEPGGPGHSHQFFKKSKNPKAKLVGEKGTITQEAQQLKTHNNPRGTTAQDP